MKIGIPKEIKTLEGRVGLVPEACGELIRQGHELFVESGAGLLSGFPDEKYLAAGVSVVPGAASLYGEAELVVKVKEPQQAEWGYLREDHLLFCFLHLAAEPILTNMLLDTGLTAVAFETVQEQDGLPILAPMSDIAGRIAIQIGGHLLHRPQGGKGVLLGGLPAAERGRVVILGAGQAGGSAAAYAAACGAEVVVFDKRRDRLAAMRALGANVTALYAYAGQIDREVRRADLLVGAVLVPGAKAPKLVSADQVAGMEPGSVIVDIAVDQGGCVETIHPTSYAAPTYRVSDVVHFGVTNMPGAVPKSASQALSASLIPYLQLLAQKDWRKNPILLKAVNVEQGKILHPALKP